MKAVAIPSEADKI